MIEIRCENCDVFKEIEFKCPKCGVPFKGDTFEQVCKGLLVGFLENEKEIRLIKQELISINKKIEDILNGVV